MYVIYSYFSRVEVELGGQSEYETRSNEYQSKKTRLQTEENSLKHEKETLRVQMVQPARRTRKSVD